MTAFLLPLPWARARPWGQYSDRRLRHRGHGRHGALITIQIIGLVYQFKTRRAPAAAEVHAVQDEEIIEFGVSAGEDAT
ncbi:MAG: hypothetical protein ACLRZH_14010 [Ruthenibacterium lactatiformans]